MHGISNSASELNNDLKKVINWAFQRKMSFNPDPNKQAQEVIFSRKLKKLLLSSFVFNNTNVCQCKSPKHLGTILDSKLAFKKYYKTILSKTNTTIELLYKLPNLMPREDLVTTYKAFARAHLNYGDLLFDQAFNVLFHEKLETIKCKASLDMTGTIRGTSKDNSLSKILFRITSAPCLLKKALSFYMIFQNRSAAYLLNLIPARNTHYSLRNSINIPYSNTKYIFSKILTFH